MEFNKKAAKVRRNLGIVALIATSIGGLAFGSLGVGSLVATAMAGNAPGEIVAKPPCVMQPICPAEAPAVEESAAAPAMSTLDTLALHAALQNPSVFGLLRALHEPDPAAETHQKWCKNLEH